MAASTPEVRALAVRLHTKLCPDSHPEGCSWHTGASHVDEPERTDWTEDAHAKWLERARVGLSFLLAVGYTVYPPGSTTPLPSSAASGGA